jgi:Cys-rich repeat protein
MKLQKTIVTFIAAFIVTLVCCANGAADISEGFEDITLLSGTGWSFQNKSAPLGSLDWFQGNSSEIPAHAGTPTSNIRANFNNTSGNGTISNWMLTPELQMRNGTTISFWTRTATGSTYPDRLELRLSTSGASTNVGTGAEDVGDFSTRLLSVNPTLIVGGYPEVWTQYTFTLTDLASGVSGRFAFRYYVTNGGSSGANSNVIAIDTVEIVVPDVEDILDTGDPNERACNPRSYTDLGNGIVQDNVTGLEWVQDANLIASRNPSFDNDGFVTWQQALDYITLLNTDEYLDHDDWRLPTIEELSTLVDAGRGNPSIDPVFIPTPSYLYWSSTTLAADTSNVWLVNFDGGNVSYMPKSFSFYVRAVRGGPYGSSDIFVINGDGTVTDYNTDLMWQQCNYGQTWSVSTCIDSAATLTWQQALEYVQELNDTQYLEYDDWRLPTRNELQRIADYSRSNPATTFPDTRPQSYWSSTTYANNTDLAWWVGFSTGDVGSPEKTAPANVRAVRGGRCQSECINDSDCWDGIFCNGPEQCEAGECVPGEPPFCPSENPVCDERITGCVGCLTNADCAEGETCDEALNSCVAASGCTADIDCDDTLFCTGVESCVEGACVDGPGDPCAEGETCDEALDSCITVPECAADLDCDDTLFCTGVESCVAGECVDGPGDPCAEGENCDENGDRCVECLNDSQCAASERCADNVCITRCELDVEYKPPVADKLKNDKKVSLKITGGEGFDPYGVIDLGPFEAEKPKVNTKKNSLKVKAVVPAGTASGTYPISVGDCIGEIEIL